MALPQPMPTVEPGSELESEVVGIVSGEGLTLFQFENYHVRVLIIAGEPWCVTKDLCEVLELGNSRKAVARLDDDEKGVTLNDTLGGWAGAIDVAATSG